MRLVLSILLIVHGLIHLFGFMKAFGIYSVRGISRPISKPLGIIWFTGFVLLQTTAVLFLIHNQNWWYTGFAAVIISQVAVITAWYDAKAGTIANILILVGALAGYSTEHFSGQYEEEARALIAESNTQSVPLLTEEDISKLPAPVIRYLHYSGAVGRPRIKNFKLTFEGKIRKDKSSDWMTFTSEQCNFINSSTRLFFMKASMHGLPVTGYHRFKNGEAFMDIRLYSLFRVQYQSGPEMGIAETVTFFNDMCCMAPGSLIDNRIQWLESDSTKVRAAFTNNGITIHAWLYFNDRGALINFSSEDRYAVDENNQMQKTEWLTPLKDYRNIHGYMLPGYAETKYRYPEEDFVYGKFKLINVEYNCDEFK